MAGAVVYGIERCDQVRKARRWLDEHRIAHGFHDFRREGLDAATLDRWLAHLPWDSLLNRRSATWRGLDAPRRAAVVDLASAREELLGNPTLVRRPVLESGKLLIVGFSDALYRSHFGTPPR
ncbi:MAG: Spx/MgsR family RNA polymerase-binding regulatory protein [Burkholderiaceae bacterium]|nr:Spx/MgsR family RNA polymerase-binding regulatory protein [Burkholderiaceae bacterium]